MADTRPVRMAHLDIALRPATPQPRGNVFGLDEDVFINVPSYVADVAPHGAMVIHAARYLRPDDETATGGTWLETTLELAVPGWRDDVVDVRYVPRSMVVGDDAPRRRRGGAVGRPAVTAPAWPAWRSRGTGSDPAATCSTPPSARAGRPPTRCWPAARRWACEGGGRRRELDGTGDGASEFEAARPKLMAIAYRMLGSVAEAEDVVGDVACAGPRPTATAIDVPEAWLVTATSRRALDVLRSARLRREEYPGVWLPEPLPPPTARPSWSSGTSR